VKDDGKAGVGHVATKGGLCEGPRSSAPEAVDGSNDTRDTEGGEEALRQGTPALERISEGDDNEDGRYGLYDRH